MPDKPQQAPTAWVPPPRKRKLRYRPPWHRGVGLALVIGGLVLVAVNVVTEFTARHLLPGGHSPLYLLLGLAVAASSLWWFGWLDRPQ